MFLICIYTVCVSHVSTHVQRLCAVQRTLRGYVCALCVCAVCVHCVCVPRLCSAVQCICIQAATLDVSSGDDHMVLGSVQIEIGVHAGV